MLGLDFRSFLFSFWDCTLSTDFFFKGLCPWLSFRSFHGPTHEGSSRYKQSFRGKILVERRVTWRFSRERSNRNLALPVPRNFAVVKGRTGRGITAETGGWKTRGQDRTSTTIRSPGLPGLPPEGSTPAYRNSRPEWIRARPPGRPLTELPSGLFSKRPSRDCGQRMDSRESLFLGISRNEA